MRNYILLIIIILFSSCQKDRLEDNKTILVGHWNWVHTEYSYGWCDYEPKYSTMTPSNSSKNFAIKFLEKGMVQFFEGGLLIQKDRIVFEQFELLENGNYLFNIKLDDQFDRILGGSVNGDTMTVNFPYIESDPNCENYLNFFVRE